MSGYPAALDTFRDTENLPGLTYNPADKRTMFAEDIQNLFAMVLAIQTTLGINPQGAADDVSGLLSTFSTLQHDTLVAAYPIDCLYFSVNSTNPNTLFGFGTWVAFGEGRMLVGFKSDDANFNVFETTGGVKEVTLTAAQSGVPAHNHASVMIPAGRPWVAPTGGFNYSFTDGVTYNTPTVAANTPANAASAHTNLPPYIVVKIWKRTA